MNRIEIKFAADEVSAKGEFGGYGAVFGNLDSYGDVIKQGAFKATLSDWKKTGKLPPMLLQHGGWGIVDTDAIPVGVWTHLAEDDKGLLAEGRLINLDTDLGKRVYGALSEKVLDGLSIGYRPKKFEMGTKPDEPRRTLTAVDLVELSIVTFPANGLARIAAVKSAHGGMTPREFERFLRDEGGFSHAQAKAIAASGYKASDPRDEDDAALVQMLRRNIATLKS